MTTIIDVALGLILLYLVLSLICTTINEFIAALFKLRANNLALTINQLIDDPGFRKTFYSHALIVSSALSSRSGVVQKAPDGVSPDDLTTTEPVKDPRPSYLDGQTFARAVIDSLDPKKPLVDIPSVQAAVNALPVNVLIRGALLASLNLAGNDIDKFRLAVANWFDSSMDRLSGNYIRQLKLISLVVGFVLATAVNADSIAVTKAIWMEHAPSDQLTQVAQQVLSNRDKLVAACTGEPAAVAECAATKLGDLEGYLRPLPIGWSPADLPQTSDGSQLILWWLQKVVGLLWTAIALSLGAPFWFDLLQKFMNLRGAGGKPASSTDKEPRSDAAVAGLAVTKEPT